jgi:hypothetical protein
VRRVSVGLVGVLLAILGAVTYGSIRSLGRQQDVARACDAARLQRWNEALALSASITGPDADGRIATECRCWALLATSQREECVELVEGVLSGAQDWVPHPILAKLVIRVRRDQGRSAEAADLARRAARAHPRDLDLLTLELLTRSVGEGEEAVLDEMQARMRSDPESALPLSLVLSAGYLRRGEFQRTLDLLGERPSALDDPLLPRWFELRSRGLGALGQGEALRRTYAEWHAAGGDPQELRARYALRVSYSGVEDPERSVLELLHDALEHSDTISDPTLHEALYERLIGHLLASGKADEALVIYDEARARFALESITRDQIVRSATLPAGAEAVHTGLASGTLLFRSGGDVDGTLRISPELTEPADSEFQEHPFPSGAIVRVERIPGQSAQRWVFRDTAGRARASGTVWPVAGETLEVRVEPRSPGRPVEFVPTPLAGDGRRRVFVVVLDCADWRLAQYLRARGELPVLDALLSTGHRAVLESTPPFTAAAMEYLVWPERGDHVTFVGLVQRLGLELGGLASVGRNPLEFLSAVLPEGQNLFRTIGAGDRVTANMLLSHGRIDAGRHAELIGPHGLHSSAPAIKAVRPLTPDEKRRFPGLVANAKFEPLVETIAAEFDASGAFAREGKLDLLLLRIEPLDILTHALFSRVIQTEQDDADRQLLWVYRYIDQRLGETWNALDQDDVFIVMSDHGIRTAMEHDEDAMFVAVGEGIPRGRAPGRPHLRGLPRVLAELFDVETNWPRTGVAPWLERERSSVARRPAQDPARR